MKKINDGGQAFPLEYSTFTYEGDPAYTNKTRTYHRVSGMSLRDYFASQALKGLLSNDDLTKLDPSAGSYENGFARQAYKLADAMLRERQKL